MTTCAVGIMLLASLLAPAALRGQDSAPPSDSSFVAFLGEFEAATRAMFNGNPAAWLALLVTEEPATLFAPFGAVKSGLDSLTRQYSWVASRFENTNATLTVEYLAREVHGDVAWVVALERSRYRYRGEDSTRTGYTRATMIFRREPAGWRLAHRHMDHLVEAPPVPR